VVLEAPLHRLADPPRGVRGELEAAAVVELLDRPDQAQDSLLDQVEERQPEAAVALGVGDHEPQVRLDHAVLRALVAALDPLRELDLLDRRQERPLRDVAQEELQGVAGGLGDGGGLECAGSRLVGALGRVDDFDAAAVGLGVERLERTLLEIELLDRRRDLAELEAAVVLSLLEEDVERGVSGKSGHDQLSPQDKHTRNSRKPPNAPAADERRCRIRKLLPLRYAE
jgi:hypothetical protein